MARKLGQHRMASTYNKGKKPLSTLQHEQPVEGQSLEMATGNCFGVSI